MKTLYFDCFSGISGDMTLGALLDLGIEEGYLVSELNKLGLRDEFELAIVKKQVSGVTATDVEVRITHDHPAGEGHHHGRNLKQILSIIEESGITPKAKKISSEIFCCLAKAEAQVHQTTPEQVHFHEVGAVDSIVDIVGCAILMDLIGAERVLCSKLTEGTGFVHCAHGMIPVPVPAVVKVLEETGIPLQLTGNSGEMVTPTGAAILAACACFCESPQLKIQKVGYGAGKKTFQKPNLLRVVLGETEGTQNEIYVLEANVDDMTGEHAGYVMKQLMDGGALDAFYTPIYMKKNRPALCLTVLCDKRDLEQMSAKILTQTTSAGMRYYPVARTVLQREIRTVATPYGDARVKVLQGFGEIKNVPEYEDVAQIAEKQQLPFDRVYHTIIGCCR